MRLLKWIVSKKYLGSTVALGYAILWITIQMPALIDSLETTIMSGSVGNNIIEIVLNLMSGDLTKELTGWYMLTGILA